MRILLAEDDHNLGTWLSRALEHAGIQVEWVNDGRLADRALQQHDNYDALVLDLGLPGLDGQAVLQRLRDRDQRLPALILTARDSLDERVRSLNAGADDFLAKPFELAELEARLHALVRRARGNEHPRLACGALVYDNPRKQFTLHGEPLALSPREHAVLRVLVQRSGEPFSKQQILDRVFSDDEDVHPEAVEVFVHRLRRASLWRLLALLLLPLLAVVTGVELWMTRHDALEAANAAYDRSLLGALKSIDANISTASGGLSAELPYTMLEFFELTASGNVYFRVASSDGLVELGNPALPLPPGPLEPGVPRFYDATYFGESVRLAAYRRAVEGAAPGADASSVLVQVAESTRSRQEFTRRFVRRAALRDTLVLALMVLGTAATLAVALRPLSRLAREVQARSPDDMTPMADSDLPADIRPLVAAANQQMARTQDLVAQQRQFLDDASHQLRTHLTTLQMQIDYARREADATQVQHTLEAIGGEVARATRSTQQLLALGRSDTAAVELAPFDLAALLRAVALELLPRARARQI